MDGRRATPARSPPRHGRPRHVARTVLCPQTLPMVEARVRKRTAAGCRTPRAIACRPSDGEPRFGAGLACRRRSHEKGSPSASLVHVWPDGYPSCIASAHRTALQSATPRSQIACACLHFDPLSGTALGNLNLSSPLCLLVRLLLRFSPCFCLLPPPPVLIYAPSDLVTLGRGPWFPLAGEAPVAWAGGVSPA